MASIEQNFLRELIALEKRHDGRKLSQMRDVDLKFGETFGNVEIRLGKTWIIVQVSASVKKPADNRPFEGVFHITTDISSMAAPHFENGRASTEEVIVSRLIEKAIRRSNALDLESLCIIAGEACWMVRADVHYLNYDGGLVDATCVGVAAALLHFKRPSTSVKGDRVIVHELDDRPPVPLSIMHLPISVTWSLLQDNLLLLDATAQEQELRTGDLTIAVNSDREICQITKAGGFSLPVETMLECCERAYNIAKDTTSLIHKRLREDEKRRNRGNMGAEINDIHDR